MTHSVCANQDIRQAAEQRVAPRAQHERQDTAYHTDWCMPESLAAGAYNTAHDHTTAQTNLQPSPTPTAAQPAAGPSRLAAPNCRLRHRV